MASLRYIKETALEIRFSGVCSLPVQGDETGQKNYKKEE